MTDHVTKAGHAIDQGKIKVALAHLLDGYYIAYAARDSASIEQVNRLARQLVDAETGKIRDEAERLVAQSEETLVRFRTENMTPEEVAQHREERAREEARIAVQERLAAVRESRRRRDTSSVRCFEYSRLELSDDAAEDHLNQAGILGWELVSVVPNRSGEHIAYFRREVYATKDKTSGKVVPLSAEALRAAGRAAPIAGGAAVAGFYYESGPDLDQDGDVDGGLFDTLGELFS